MNALKPYLEALAPWTAWARGTEKPGAPPVCVAAPEDAAPLRADTLYVLPSGDWPSLAGREDLRGCTFFIEDAPGLDPGAVPAGCAVVCVRLSAARISSLLSETLARQQFRRRIDDMLLMAEDAGYSVEQLLHAMSHLLDVSVCVLDPALRIIGVSFSGVSQDRFSRELSATGGLSRESADAIRADAIRADASLPAYLHEGSVGKWAKFFVLLLWNGATRVDAPYLCGALADFIARVGERNRGLAMPRFLVDEQFNRILSGSVSDEASIRACFGMDGESWFAMLVLQPDPVLRSADFLENGVRLLRGAFQNCVATAHQGMVCALVRLNVDRPDRMKLNRAVFGGRNYAPGWDDQRMEGALRDAGAYLCYASAFCSWYSVRTIYELASSSLEIALKLGAFGSSRIVDFQDYNPFNVVRFCTDSFLRDHEPRHLKMLMYPEVLTLLRYDFANGSDLSRILYFYFLTGDVGKTAQALYMHRNTVYNKLKTIEKILGISVDDISIRSCYSTALQIYFYCEKCLGIDMRALLMPEEA